MSVVDILDTEVLAKTESGEQTLEAPKLERTSKESVRTPPEPEYFFIPDDSFLYVTKIDIPELGRYQGRLVVHVNAIPGTDVSKKRRLFRKWKSELRKLNEENPKPEKGPVLKDKEVEKFLNDYPMFRDKRFSLPPPHDLSSRLLFKRVQNWLDNDPEWKRCERKARTWRTLRHEKYDLRVNPLVKEYWRGMGHQNQELLIVYDPDNEFGLAISNLRKEFRIGTAFSPQNIPYQQIASFYRPSS